MAMILGSSLTLLVPPSKLLQTTGERPDLDTRTYDCTCHCFDIAYQR